MSENNFNGSDEQYKQYGTNSIIKAVEGGRLDSEDAKLVKEFISEVNIQNNLSPKRRFKLISNLITALDFVKVPVKELALGDLYESIEALHNGKRLVDGPRGKAGKEYTTNTKADLIRILKRFSLWLAESGYLTISQEKIKKIKVPTYTTKTGEDTTLTDEEVLRLIDAPKTTRYKALIGVLFESGCRIGEIAEMKWRDVGFYDWGCQIKTSGKTGKVRHIPIIIYYQLLTVWKSEHPNPEPGEYVFLNTKNQPLKYQSVLKNIRIFAKRAEITKNLTPHMLRHTRITNVLREGMSETIVKDVFWGNVTTDMIKVYSHLTKDDARNAFARAAGVEIKNVNTESIIKPIVCTKCHKTMPPESRFCARCGRPLTQEAINDVEQAKSFIVQKMKDDPSLSMRIAQRLSDL